MGILTVLRELLAGLESLSPHDEVASRHSPQQGNPVLGIVENEGDRITLWQSELIEPKLFEKFCFMVYVQILFQIGVDFQQLFV